MVTAYRFVSRPADSPHQHPVLVFDLHGRLHFHLTAFAKAAISKKRCSTALGYLYAILPFFTFLEANKRQVEARRRWDGHPEQVRFAVTDYLTQRLDCKVDDHRKGFLLVARTRTSSDNVRVFLAGLRLFYSVMKQSGYYAHGNPLVDENNSTAAEIKELLDAEDEEFPRMPDVSGVEEPRASVKRFRRLSDCFFKLEDDGWVPQVIDDFRLYADVMRAGERHGWRLREQCVTRLLFESGGRVSEVTGLTLKDWASRGLLQSATAFSKGSNGRRVKTFRFSQDTAKLLRRYFDQERRNYDPDRLTLADYLRAEKHGGLDLYSVPFFLTAQGTQLTPKLYRDLYWNPACEAAGIIADVHQARHWYVTMAVRAIYETATGAEIKRKLTELVEYMKWRSGWQTLNAYEHYFDAERHAEVQDTLHARMDASLQSRVKSKRAGGVAGTDAVTAPGNTPTVLPNSEANTDFEFLMLVGEGGYDDRNATGTAKAAGR